ncbi:hypothetical protein BC834DRAFT_973337 [Gloeopeniophorella convolvens]|nr:hypothetical protein BC834DRAFT_973337 [Gloeopeniophorella convolvens]
MTFEFDPAHPTLSVEEQYNLCATQWLSPAEMWKKYEVVCKRGCFSEEETAQLLEEMDCFKAEQSWSQEDLEDFMFGPDKMAPGFWT